MKEFYRQSCKTDTPYPIPTGLKPDRRTARLLLASYAGPESELTAISQYIYHYLMAAEDYRPLAYMLKQIAEVEMHHLALIGNVIRQLGADPRYVSYRGQMRLAWNGNYVRYGGDIKEQVECDLLGEYAAIEHYKSALARIDDLQIRALITRIVEDEELHVMRLEAALGALE